VRAHGGPLGSGAELQPRGSRSAALEPPRCDTHKRRGSLHLAIQVPNDVQGPRGAEPPRRSGHVVSLTIKDDRRVLLLARSPSRWWRGTFLAWREGAAIWLFSRDRVSEKAARAARARAGSFRYSLNVGKP